MPTPHNPHAGRDRVRATWTRRLESSSLCRERSCDAKRVWAGYCGRCLHRLAARERARATDATAKLGALAAACERLVDAVVTAGPRPDLIDDAGASPELDALEDAVGAAAQALRFIAGRPGP